MMLPLVANGVLYDGRISASPPSVYNPAEEAGVVTGLPVRQRLKIQLPTESLQDPVLDGARLNFPLSYPVDKRIGSVAVVVVGLAYATLLAVGCFGGVWIILGGQSIGYCSEEGDGDTGTRHGEG
jgi:hypothetical protein